MTIFPNVPVAPGVPPVSREPGVTASAIELLVIDAVSAFGPSFLSQWGLFLDGVPVIEPDTIARFGFRKEAQIPNYPQEQGSFESYNKVQTPYQGRIRMATGGSVADKQAFLAEVAAAQASTDLYDIVTPEVIYLNANVVRYDYDRSAVAGLGLLPVDVWVEEVSVTVQALFTSTQQPSGQSPQGGGQVTPTPASVVQMEFAQFAQ